MARGGTVSVTSLLLKRPRPGSLRLRIRSSRSPRSGLGSRSLPKTRSSWSSCRRTWTPANLLDLAGRTVVITPDGRGGYSRSVRDVALEEDIGKEPSSDRQEIELDFPFEFSGRTWRSFFATGNGLITFGKPFPSWDSGTPSRFGTMQMIADAFLVAPTISALYKPHLGARTYVSSKLDRVVVTWDARDIRFAVYGRRPKEALRYQIALHSDGSVALHYGPQPADADEAIRDGIVGLFPLALPFTHILHRAH